MVYYVHAAVSTLLFVLWAIFYSDHPRESVFVSDVELETINRGKTKAHITGDGDVPYKAIFL
jgi:hypothetical protein